MTLPVVVSFARFKHLQRLASDWQCLAECLADAWNYIAACTEKFGGNIVLVRGEARLERVIDRNRDNVPCLIAATSVICLRYTRSVHLNTPLVEIVFPQPTEQCLRENSCVKTADNCSSATLPLYHWLKFWYGSLVVNFVQIRSCSLVSRCFIVLFFLLVCGYCFLFLRFVCIPFD